MISYVYTIGYKFNAFRKGVPMVSADQEAFLTPGEKKLLDQRLAIMALLPNRMVVTRAFREPIPGARGIKSVIPASLNKSIKSKSSNPADQTVIRALSVATNGRLVAFLKERVTDLASRYDDVSNHLPARKGQYMGFLVCDKTSLEIMCVIELYAWAGGHKGDIAASALASKTCAAANVPLVTIDAKYEYDVAEMTALLRPHVASLVCIIKSTN
jgi:hypothetical protein